MAIRGKVATKYALDKFFDGYNQLDSPISAVPIYKEMSNDPTINGVLDAIRISIHEATYEIQAPDNPTTQEKRIAAILTSAFQEQLDFKRFIKSATNNLIYGFQVFEIEMEERRIPYKRTYTSNGEERERTDTANIFVPVGLYPLPPETLTEEYGARNRRGEITYLTQNIDGQKIDLPIETLLIINTKSFSEADWRGTSPLKSVYDPWFMKEKFWLIQAEMLEKYGPGIDVITLPVQEEGVLNSSLGNNEAVITVSPDKIRELKEAAQNEINAISDGTAKNIVLNAGYQLEILERQGDFPDINATIKELKEEIVTALIAPQLKLGGSSSGGSYSLGVNFTNLFIQSVQGRANDILDEFNQKIIKMTVEENFGPQARYPKMIVSNIAKSSAQEMFLLLQYLTSLANSPKVLQKGAGEMGVQLDQAEAESLVNQQLQRMQPRNQNENRENNNEQQSEDQNVEEN